MGKPKGFKEKEKKRWMSKDGKSSMVWESLIDQRLAEGWHFGHDTDKQKDQHKRFYNNGVKNIVIRDGDEIPEGYKPGMWQKRPGGFSKFEYKWYTNGIESKRLSIINGDVVPEGWWEGQSDLQAEKSRNAPKGKKRTEEQRKHYREGAKKQWEHKKINGTTITSSIEELLYKWLCNYYSNDDVFRNYDHDVRYPWHCDFYVKSEDLFIEVHAFPTHYHEPFDINNKNHIKLLEHCKLNPDSWVQTDMITVWAGADVMKKEKALDNNLNYIMLYYNDAYTFNNATTIYNKWLQNNFIDFNKSFNKEN